MARIVICFIFNARKSQILTNFSNPRIGMLPLLGFGNGINRRDPEIRDCNNP